MLSFLFLFCFLGPHPRPIEGPRLGVPSELQLPVYTTAMATRDFCFKGNVRQRLRQGVCVCERERERERDGERLKTHERVQ